MRDTQSEIRIHRPIRQATSFLINKPKVKSRVGGRKTYKEDVDKLWKGGGEQMEKRKTHRNNS